MPHSIKQLQAAGAVAAATLYYQSIRGTKAAWSKVYEWCRREWPDIKPSTIEAIVKRAKASVSLADRINRMDDEHEFDHKAELKKAR